MNDDIGLDFTLEHIFENLTELPTFPQVVHKAMGLLEDPNTTTTELANVLRYDQAITANIIRMTNSARFGLPQEVKNLETALALLGHRELKEILMASASLPYLSKPMFGYGMAPSDLWIHAIACALTAEVVAAHCRYSDAPSLFTAALLHDMGKIVLNIYVGDKLDAIVRLAATEKVTFTEAEWRVLGGDHAVIGSEILRLWEFPHAIVRAVRSHHDPDLCVQDDLSALLALANILTVQLGMGVGADGFRNVLTSKLVDRLALTPSRIHGMLAQSLAAYERAEDLFRLYSGESS